MKATHAKPSRQPSTARITTIIATAQRLRAARAACRQFLFLWAMEQQRQNLRSDSEETTLADPMNHDWSLLYTGSILDD